MIKVEIRKSFINDLKSIKGNVYYDRIKNLALFELPKMDSMKEIRNLKKLKGFRKYYRIRVGEFRIGLSIENDVLILERVLNRKDIYNYFPK